jgi:protein-S-isoprenylcysteine O-methyltransferase Ste14
MDTTPSADAPPLSAKSAKFAVAVEKAVFPWLFLFLAGRRLIAALGSYPTMEELLHATLSRDVLLFIQNVLLFILIGLYGVMLLLSRPAVGLPTRRRHILIPLAMSAYFMLYGVLDFLPPPWRENLLPPGFQRPCALAGVIVSMIGYSIAIWAIFYLRRSFAVFVSVREVIFKGPYAYVRHPMYLGYLFDSCGIALVTFSAATLFLCFGFIILLVYRARMEEEKLREASTSYRVYANRAGFLFPRFRRSAPPDIS